MDEGDFKRIATELMPGMETVVYAGDTLVITDNAGQEFAVSGRESEEVMKFLEAFDTWLTTKNALVSGVVLDAAYAEMTRLFNALPLRIQRSMPSFKRLGVSIPGHH